MQENDSSTQYLPRSQRIVRVCREEGSFRYQSPMGEVFAEQIENIACFAAQLCDGDYLVLERRDVAYFRILGIVQAGSVLHEVYDIAFSFDLEFGFGEDVEAEVAAFVNAPQDWSSCEDFRHVPFVTVDGAGTRDLDQALYVGTPEDGLWNAVADCRYIVWYAIADASWFVRPGSALFTEALRRGTSVYFAGMSVPMLPHALSQGIVSLNEDVDRRALVFVMQLDARGKCLRTDLRRGRVHSRAKLVTEDVSAFLADPEHHPWRDREYAQSLRDFKEVGILRMAESRLRNVVHFHRVALDVGLNRQKTDFTVGLDERIDVDMYNEQLSLLCNMEGAAILKRLAEVDPDVLAIFRNHEAPSPRDLDEVYANMMAIVRTQDMPPVWYWDRSRQSLADYFESLPVESQRADFDATEAELRPYRVRQALERQVLMMQRRSVFSPDAGLHSALGVNPYARFSAPMREIVGVFTHGEAIDAEFSPEIREGIAEKKAIRELVIEASNRAKTLQNNVDKAIDSAAIAHVISHDFDVPFETRPRRRGTILGMKASAIYVRLDMPPIELKVYVRDICESSGDEWQIEADMTALHDLRTGRRFVVGDSIELVVSSYEPTKKKWRVVPCLR